MAHLLDDHRPGGHPPHDPLPHDHRPADHLPGGRRPNDLPDPVHAPLAEHARRRPHAPFLLAADGFTYAQAARWVAHVAARHLRPFAGERVALWLDKGNHYALALLAALQARCTCVPLDGTQPVQRAGLILADADPRVLIADHAHAALLLEHGLPAGVRRLLLAGAPSALPALAAPPGVQVLPLDPPAAAVQAGTGTSFDPAPDLDAGPRTDPAQIAAVLYTSGSTGTPKGVQLSHGNLANFVRWSVRELEIGAADRLLNLASFNFDLSTFDLFATLRAGAALYVSSEAEAAHVATVAQLLRGQGISVVYSVPSMYALLNRIDAWAALRGGPLRCVVFAGEVMPKPQLQAMAAALHGHCRFYNFYGPTETNVCLHHRVGPVDLASDAPLPIGRPIDGACVWLADEQGRLVAGEGTLGEIWVAGPCVTPGYWQRHDPRNAAHHAQGMHATGDYGEWSRGALLYRGRRDRMLKLGGYRVELGEIEAVLARHPLIHEAAVLADTAGAAPRLLAAYATRDPQQRLGSLELKAYCARHLPRYMVPHAFTRHHALPRNPNGKIDYRALSETRAGVAA